MPLLRCVNCSLEMDSHSLGPSCVRCGSAVLLVERAIPHLKRGDLERTPPGVWRYRTLIPAPRSENLVTLGEGGTPLLRAPGLGEELSFKNLLIKDETRNPTGSFIDRGSTVLASLAKEAGVRTCSCITTGNLGASLAAYCAKGGIATKIRIHSNTDREKLYQMIAYGAEVEAISKPVIDQPGDDHSLSVTAGNPYLLEGEKTTCFEIVQELGWVVPDVIVIPVGTGGHLSMVWRAILQLRASGLIDESECRLMGVQFAGSAPMVGRSRPGRGRSSTEAHFTELEESEPFFKNEAARAMRKSGGTSLETTTTETIRATGLLARTEGIFAEPAAASVIASLKTARSDGFIDSDETVVCIITGAGLKDTKAISRIAKATRQVVVSQDYSAARLQLGGTKLSLLRSLAARPHFGYELWKGLSAQREITTASVYQHLGELETLGLARKSRVSTVRGRERVFYELTRRGSEFVRMAGRMDLGKQQSAARR